MASIETETEFEEFFHGAEPRLRQALVARYGPHDGRDAAAEALTWAFQHWQRLEEMQNAMGYLYRVGCSSQKPARARFLRGDPWIEDEPRFEPQLLPALQSLSPRQREAVVLIDGYGWKLREVADLTDRSISSINTNRRRGLTRLRRLLGVTTTGDRDGSAR